MSKLRFLIIGDMPLATKVFKELYSHPSVEVVGVLCSKKSCSFTNDPWEDNTCLYDEAVKTGAQIFHDQEELVEKFDPGGIDYGISCRYSRIFYSPFINLFAEGLMNLHGGILPSRGGLNIANHCIIEGDKWGGGTLHFIDEGIDTGDIIAREYFALQSSDTSFTVYQKTQLALFRAFSQSIESIVSQTIKAVPQSVYIANGEKKEYFNKKALDKRKEIDLATITPEELDRRVRGLDFPGHESAYTVINGNKIYMTTQPFFKS